jgi:hypothetical protein
VPGDCQVEREGRAVNQLICWGPQRDERPSPLMNVGSVGERAPANVQQQQMGFQRVGLTVRGRALCPSSAAGENLRVNAASGNLGKLCKSK